MDEKGKEKKPSNLLTVGRLTGVFGIKGWFKVKSYTDPQENLLDYQPLLMKTRHGIRECEIVEFNFRPQGLVVRLKDIDNRNVAEDLAPVDLAVDKLQLPELDGQDYYWHQLAGLRVVSVYSENKAQEISVDFGVVERLVATGSNDVLDVRPDDQSFDDKPRLLPYVLDLYVKKVDLEAGVITVDWDPEF